MWIIRQLLWDAWNIAHVGRHEVTPSEVLEICQQEPITSETYGGRLRVIGRTRGRILTAILAPQSEEGVYYVITARTASRKERQLYREQKGGVS
jgi:uncharacterized DUF497 family protein